MNSAPALSCQPKGTVARQDAPMPYTYGYLYPDNCVRFNGGELWNGQKPIRSIPLYDEKAIATLKSRLEQAERAVDVLESNARVQAKLLADTGRRAEVLEGALRDAERKMVWGLDTAETTMQRKTAFCLALTAVRAALSPAGNGEVGK